MNLSDEHLVRRKPLELQGQSDVSTTVFCNVRVYLAVDAKDADCLGGEAILAGGQRIGAVSSGAWGPSVEASLAFGYVAPDHAGADTELEVLVLGERRPARVLGEAMYDPGNERPRA